MKRFPGYVARTKYKNNEAIDGGKPVLPRLKLSRYK
jgi:hypothetical protein